MQHLSSSAGTNSRRGTLPGPCRRAAVSHSSHTRSPPEGEQSSGGLSHTALSPHQWWAGASYCLFAHPTGKLWGDKTSS